MIIYCLTVLNDDVSYNSYITKLPKNKAILKILHTLLCGLYLPCNNCGIPALIIVVCAYCTYYRKCGNFCGKKISWFTKNFIIQKNSRVKIFMDKIFTYHA